MLYHYFAGGSLTPYLITHNIITFGKECEGPFRPDSAHITCPRRAYLSRFISNTSHIFVINWPSISKLGEVIEKDTFFPGKQETFIYV